MRILIPLAAISTLATGYSPGASPIQPAWCASDTSGIVFTRGTITQALTLENYSTLGLPSQSPDSTLVVVTDSSGCTAARAGLLALGQDSTTINPVLVLRLGTGGFAVEVNGDQATHHYFNSQWQYLFSLLGI